MPFHAQPYQAREQYQRIKQLHAGGPMSNGIFLVEKHGKKYVEKKVEARNPSRWERVVREIRTLRAVRGHRNVNEIKEVFEDHRSASFSIIVDYCEGGALDGYMKSHMEKRIAIPEAFCWHVLAGLASALAFCHTGEKTITSPASNRPRPGWDTICHLDIKPPNIFLGKQESTGFPRIVLGDFGCSVTRKELAYGITTPWFQEHGTPGWFPPENGGAKGDGSPGYYGPETDVWQMGALVHVLCRKLATPHVQLMRVRPCGGEYSKVLAEVVLACTHDVHQFRPTAVDVVIAVQRREQDKEGRRKGKENERGWRR